MVRKMIYTDYHAEVSDGECAPGQRITGEQAIIGNPVDSMTMERECKIIHIFGPPNSGKTTLRKALAEMYPGYPNYCIDDFRIIFGDGTMAGEVRSQIGFLDSMISGGFFECSGAGKFTAQIIKNLRFRPQYIVVMDTPAEICISRIREGKYDGIPFPFTCSGEEFIKDVSIYLASELFTSLCEGIPLIRLDTSYSVMEQAEEVGRFAGLDSIGGVE